MEMLDCSGDAAADGEVDALIAQDEFYAGEGLEHHQLIEIAQMADAEDAAGNLGQAYAEREAVGPVGMAYEFVRVEAFGQEDCAHRIGMAARLRGAELQAPGLVCLADAFGEATMAGEDLVEALLEEEIERGAKAAEEMDRRRIGEEALLVGARHVGEIEIAAAR